MVGGVGLGPVAWRSAPWSRGALASRPALSPFGGCGRCCFLPGWVGGDVADRATLRSAELAHWCRGPPFRLLEGVSCFSFGHYALPISLAPNTYTLPRLTVESGNSSITPVRIGGVGKLDYPTHPGQNGCAELVYMSKLEMRARERKRI